MRVSKEVFSEKNLIKNAKDVML